MTVALIMFYAKHYYRSSELDCLGVKTTTGCS
jgi:hypothetical protein